MIDYEKFIEILKNRDMKNDSIIEKYTVEQDRDDISIRIDEEYIVFVFSKKTGKLKYIANWK